MPTHPPLSLNPHSHGMVTTKVLPWPCALRVSPRASHLCPQWPPLTVCFAAIDRDEDVLCHLLDARKVFYTDTSRPYASAWHLLRVIHACMVSALTCLTRILLQSAFIALLCSASTSLSPDVLNAQMKRSQMLSKTAAPPQLWPDRQLVVPSLLLARLLRQELEVPRLVLLLVALLQMCKHRPLTPPKQVITSMTVPSKNALSRIVKSVYSFSSLE